MVLQRVHGVLYKSLNDASMRLLKRTGLPPWLTADVVTAGRLTLVVPTLALASRGHQWAPASLVIINAVMYAQLFACAFFFADAKRSKGITSMAQSLVTTTTTPHQCQQRPCKQPNELRHFD